MEKEDKELSNDNIILSFVDENDVEFASVTITKKELDNLTKLAEEENVSLEQLILNAIIEWAGNDEEESKKPSDSDSVPTP